MAQNIDKTPQKALLWVKARLLLFKVKEDGLVLPSAGSKAKHPNNSV